MLWIKRLRMRTTRMRELWRQDACFFLRTMDILCFWYTLYMGWLYCMWWRLKRLSVKFSRFVNVKIALSTRRTLIWTDRKSRTKVRIPHPRQYLCRRYIQQLKCCIWLQIQSISLSQCQFSTRQRHISLRRRVSIRPILQLLQILLRYLQQAYIILQTRTGQGQGQAPLSISVSRLLWT